MGRKMDGRKAARGARLPKRIGGVKLPKELRRTGARLIDTFGSPAGQEMIATALTLVAGALTASAKRTRAAAAAVAPDPGKAAPASAATTTRDPHDIGVALGKAAESALRGLFEPRSRH